MNIIYVPLDERPCNYKHPKLLSEITENINLLMPPIEYMGKLKKPADCDKLWQWLFENIHSCDYAILSIDTLIYGNIVNSRIHHKNMDECENLLSNIIKLKSANPRLEIHAFNLVARVGNHDNSAEDPDYWQDYGKKIWTYSCLLDKTNRKIITEEESLNLKKLKEEIPEDFLLDFLKRRKIDKHVNLQCVELVKDGIIDYLVIPKDDTALFGYAAMDQAEIAKKIFYERLSNKIMIYPGADEVGSILFARVFNIIKGYCPKVYVRYSSTLGASIIPKYEDRPLNEGIKAQITSMGGIYADTPQESDFLLAVNSPGAFMAECAEQFNNKDLTYYSHINLHEFIRYMNYYIDTYKKPVAVSDVAFANGSDNEFMQFAATTGLLEHISAYGGWNTSSNTIGMCLAHANIASYYSSLCWEKGNKHLSTEFILRKIIEDWLFQANMLYQLFEQKYRFPHIDFYNVTEYEEKIIKLMQKILEQNIDRELRSEFNGYHIAFGNLTLPWDRAFDIDFDLKLE